MATMFKKPLIGLLLVVSASFSLFLSASAQTCRSTTFANRIYSACNDLPVLNSFLHWNYEASNRTVSLAYRHRISSRKWVAWAINPTGRGMIGAQALVAFQQSDGSMTAYTSPISGYGTQLQRGNLSFEVPDITAETMNNEIIVYATLRLPGNSASVNQVWQEGALSGNSPQIHEMNPANRQATGTIDFQSGQSAGSGNTDPRLKRKNVHGVLNAVSWGILMPLGAIIARYLKVAKSTDPAWFYLHVACQSSAYAIGVAGWATGLKLGSDSTTLKYSTHRNIGITLFVLGTLQVFALLLRPKPDNKYRFYWNIYHHVTGYTVIILSVVNIFKGFDILQPEEGKWKRAYIGVIAALAVVAVLLEAFTWMVVLKRKKEEAKSHHGVNGMNGGNGYGGRTQHV
ncbi:hypothetical protein Scep_012550 [Stephania cephalantha]|uniref:Cytochrome b561 and DOMON domain-containing protein n=1 Tax=Stephania cephalantha TaxID=152367 RepID=A0AAP0JHI8_9MAGN